MWPTGPFFPLQKVVMESFEPLGVKYLKLHVILFTLYLLSLVPRAPSGNEASIYLLISLKLQSLHWEKNVTCSWCIIYGTLFHTFFSLLI